MTGDPTRTRTDGPLLARRYRLLAQVGRGGMGTVWQAHDEVLGRDVAVKEVILPHGFSDDDRALQYKRTFREARTAARLGHPGVVTVYDVVEEDGRPWIIMELIKTRSLDQVIKEEGALDPLRAADIGRQMLAALHAAHTAGVLHRDVKPSNVLLAAGDRAVLTDFGIAIAEGDATLTQTGLVMGSPAYIAPERARGRTAGPASDLWSLGVTLYAMVDGRSPFERSEPMAALVAIISEEPPPATSAGPLRPVIEGLLCKDPDARMEAREAGLLLDDILREASEDALQTHPVPPPEERAPTEAPAEGSAADAAAEVNASAAPPAADVTLLDSRVIDDPDRTSVVGAAPDAAQPPEPSRPAPPAREPAADQGAAGGYADASVTVFDARVSPEFEARPPVDLDARSAADFEGREETGSRTSSSERGESATRPPAGSPYGPPAYVASSGRSRTALIIAGIILAAVLVLVLLALVNRGDNAQGDNTGQGTSGTPVQGTRVGTSRAASAKASPAASGKVTTRSATAATSRPPAGAVPEGFRAHTDETFSTVIPKDWSSPQRKQGGVFFYAPDRGTYVQVDYQEDANPSALDDWKRAARSSSFSGYQEIKLGPVTDGEPRSDPTGRNAADWEFTHQGSSGRVHVLNRGLVMNGHGYAILLSAPDEGWNRTWPDLQPVYERFTSIG